MVVTWKKEKIFLENLYPVLYCLIKKGVLFNLLILNDDQILLTDDCILYFQHYRPAFLSFRG